MRDDEVKGTEYNNETGSFDYQLQISPNTPSSLRRQGSPKDVEIQIGYICIGAVILIKAPANFSLHLIIELSMTNGSRL